VKSHRGGVAEYLYRWGDTLKRVDSSIPGEPKVVAYVTDASHRRRLRTVYQDNPSTVTEQTWYRWEGSSQVGEYAQGAGGAWDIGTLEKTYLPGLAEVAGDHPTTDTYRYHLTDHLGSVRGIVDGGTDASS
jgi:hypothetical protein